MSGTKIMNESYFCTWCVQGAAAYKNKQKREIGEITFEGDQGGLTSRDAINEETVFGKDGWINYYPEIRKDLYFLIDDGWDVDYNTKTPDDFSKFGSFVVNEQRFPSFKGSPDDKLKEFVERVKAAGWKGLGVWLPAQAYGEDFEKPVKECIPYWRAMLERSKYAGVSYWKVDWGKCAYTTENRKTISELAREVYPELVVEHGICMWLVNDRDSDYGRFENDAEYKRGVEMAEYSDVLRTYDHSQLGISTTLDRVASVLPNSKALINCESLAYMAAGLGFSLGIMGDPESENGKEALATIRWHRVAPTFIGTETYQSEEILYDYFSFTEGSTYAPFLIGRKVHQGAPAIISRNTKLPLVEAEGEKPFVVASLNPTGAYSVAELGRFLEKETNPLADVTCFVECNPENIGVFGDFSSVTFELLTSPISVKAQNLLTEEIVDISSKITLDKKLKISGEILKEINGETSNKSAVRLIVTY